MFHLQQLLPLPLKEQYSKSSEVWMTEQRFQAGKRYFVSAASGKGKTTLQMMLYGIRKDYEGQLSLEQTLEGQKETKNINDLSLEDWAVLRQKHLSIIFQDLRLFPELSVWENIQLKNGLTNHKTAQEIQEMLSELEILDYLQKPCGKLSYGQRQRVAIVRALCQPFQLLLMDEPFSHLDTENIRKCCALITKECAAQGAGYILASLGDQYFLEYDKSISL